MFIFLSFISSSATKLLDALRQVTSPFGVFASTDGIKTYAGDPWTEPAQMAQSWVTSPSCACLGSHVSVQWVRAWDFPCPGKYL